MEYVIRTGISHGELDKIFRKLESAKQAIYEGYCQLDSHPCNHKTNQNHMFRKERRFMANDTTTELSTKKC